MVLVHGGPHQVAGRTHRRGQPQARKAADAGHYGCDYPVIKVLEENANILLRGDPVQKPFELLQADILSADALMRVAVKRWFYYPGTDARFEQFYLHRG